MEPLRAQDADATAGALAAERVATDAQIADLTAEFNAIVEAAAADVPDDEHDPDGSTVGFERARVAALLEHARRRRAEIDEALERLNMRTYGLCERCGRAIAPERLAAQPATTTCITCASAPPARLSRHR